MFITKDHCLFIFVRVAWDASRADQLEDGKKIQWLKTQAIGISSGELKYSKNSFQFEVIEENFSQGTFDEIGKIIRSSESSEFRNCSWFERHAN